MSTEDLPANHLIAALREREKELRCLYRIHELTDRTDTPLETTLRGVVEAIPAGWQHPEVCWARIRAEGIESAPPGAVDTPWVQRAPILLEGTPAGMVEVFYTRALPDADEGPFLKEERQLIDTIAARLAHLLQRRRLGRGGHERAVAPPVEGDAARAWIPVVDFLRQTDQRLLRRLARRLLNHLAASGIPAAQEVLQRAAPAPGPTGENEPLERRVEELPGVVDETFEIAYAHLGGAEIIALVQRWIKDERASFLVETVENPGSSIQDIARALDQFERGDVGESDLSPATRIGLRVGLIRRFLTEDLEFVEIAKHHLGVADFERLTQRVIAPVPGFGRLGGKSSGLFLGGRLAQSAEGGSGHGGVIRTPRTWYITSDGLLHFINHNQLQDVHNWKYLEAEQIRREYPHLVQVFKQSSLPPSMLNALALALDDLGEIPLIVRSSSLLEDRMGSAFAGKYKSLFLANRGTKRERLAALADAIAEVYASAVGPDPIEYRAAHGLLDLHEEMGIMIQQVVGTRVGPYFMPLLAGVAFSRNELRWSPRIRREDGLLRIVPGLGTRAVDRLSDDHPVLVAPGQPDLRVNVAPEEVLRYSPKRLDAINVETGRFETVDCRTLLERHGSELPRLTDLVSVWDGETLRTPERLDTLPAPDRLVVTFEGLLRRTPFVERLRALLTLLGDRFGVPVDLEFAFDGADLFLLQCRAQSRATQAAPVAIPRDLPPARVIFSANRYVSDGQVTDLTHIVYVDPDRYGALASLDALKRVGRAVGRLNRVLPRRRFVLMGPGRWGSRGDVRLGVNVTYADISNTAMLIEIARRRGNYLPDLSFGTHFFQDLVEADIRYLPLYPDNPQIQFNERFLTGAPNQLATLAPEFADLEETIRVIDVPGSAEGAVLRVLMNADLDEAVGFLVPGRPASGPVRPREYDGPAPDEGRGR